MAAGGEGQSGGSCIAVGPATRVPVMKPGLRGAPPDARDSVSRPDAGECAGGRCADWDESGAAAPVLDAAVGEGAPDARGDHPGFECGGVVGGSGSAGVGGAGTWELDQ